MLTSNYVFRGTTLGFKGGSSTNKLGVTPTTLNPAKAAIFAASAQTEYHTPGVIWICSMRKIEFARMVTGNVLENMEEEIAYSLPPAVFQDACEGFIPLYELVWELKKAGIYIPSKTRFHDLSADVQSVPPFETVLANYILQTLLDKIKK